MRRFLSFFRRDDAPSAIEEQRAIIADCRKVLALRRPHPMASFFARDRLASAEARLRMLEDRQADVAAEADLRASLRQRWDQARSPYDPISKDASADRPRPMTLGTTSPELPQSACWLPPLP